MPTSRPVATLLGHELPFGEDPDVARELLLVPGQRLGVDLPA